MRRHVLGSSEAPVLVADVPKEHWGQGTCSFDCSLMLADSCMNKCRIFSFFPRTRYSTDQVLAPSRKPRRRAVWVWRYQKQGSHNSNADCTWTVGAMAR